MSEDYIDAKIAEEEDDEEEGPILSLHETILLLDRLVKGGNGIDCEYVSSEMEKAYPLLRKAALDGERYREAGEALVDFFVRQYEDRDTDITQKEVESALTSYRQAVEQKEVPVSTLKVPYCNKCYPDHDHTRQETVEQKEV